VLYAVNYAACVVEEVKPEYFNVWSELPVRKQHFPRLDRAVVTRKNDCVHIVRHDQILIDWSQRVEVVEVVASEDICRILGTRHQFFTTKLALCPVSAKDQLCLVKEPSDKLPNIEYQVIFIKEIAFDPIENLQVVRLSALSGS